MDRTIVRKGRLTDPEDNRLTPGTPAERLAMVWPLTRELASLSGYDVEQRLQRHVVVLKRRER